MQITYDDFVKVDIRVGTKKIGPFMSECLTLGLPDEKNNVVLITPTLSVPNGGKLF